MLELPEVLTLSRQLHQELRGKTIAAAGPGNSPHKFAFIKPSLEEFGKVLARKKIESVKGEGKCIFFALKPHAVFSIAEMDGRLRFHAARAELPPKYHVLLWFTDGSALTATVGLWGFFGVGDSMSSSALDQSQQIDPLSADFTLAKLNQLFAEYPKGCGSLCAAS
jgi:formamidopyrimidine-DNA glycosylase